AWIALCVLVIPNRPWRSITAALVSAAMVPAAHLFCAHVLHYTPMAWNRLASYGLSPLFVAGWTPFLSTRIYQMQKDLSRSTDLFTTRWNFSTASTRRHWRQPTVRSRRAG